MSPADLDPYLSIRALAQYSGFSVRKLRAWLRDPVNPLPHYRLDRAIRVRRSDFDAWIAVFRQRPPSDDTEADIVADLVRFD